MTSDGASAASPGRTDGRGDGLPLLVASGREGERLHLGPERGEDLEVDRRRGGKAGRRLGLGKNKIPSTWLGKSKKGGISEVLQGATHLEG